MFMVLLFTAIVGVVAAVIVVAVVVVVMTVVEFVVLIGCKVTNNKQGNFRLWCFNYRFIEYFVNGSLGFASFGGIGIKFH